MELWDNLDYFMVSLKWLNIYIAEFCATWLGVEIHY